jgi:hypothetical protein
MTLTQELDKAPPASATWPGIVPGSVCVVTLVDRRTGATLSLNGHRVAVYTRAPRIAAEELLAGRDPALWDVRVLALDPARRR